VARKQIGNAVTPASAGLLVERAEAVLQ